MSKSLRILRYLSAILPLSFLSVPASKAQTLPVPDHIVVVIMENYGYPFIIGSTNAPYINSFVTDTFAANFSGFYALTHPSQPNYLFLYAGGAQGNNDDGIPAGIPFTSPNMGAELIAASKTFITYSEDMPSAGYNGGTYTAGGANYARKHNPVANWMGTAANQVPASVNQSFTAFPNAANYAALPTVSYVVPNQDNDMHDGNFPANISLGDTWIKTHIDTLRQWVLTHNSLLIITFDEDNGLSSNKIPTIFYGPMVKGGTYANKETLVNLLGTIETMYGLGHAGAPFTGLATNDSAITYCWRRTDTTHHDTTITAVNNMAYDHVFTIAPNPATNMITFQPNQQFSTAVTINVIDINGRCIGKYTLNNGTLSVNTSSCPAGVYYYKIMNDKGVLDEGKFIIANH